MAIQQVVDRQRWSGTSVTIVGETQGHEGNDIKIGDSDIELVIYLHHSK